MVATHSVLCLHFATRLIQLLTRLLTVSLSVQASVALQRHLDQLLARIPHLQQALVTDKDGVEIAHGQQPHHSHEHMRHKTHTLIALDCPLTRLATGPRALAFVQPRTALSRRLH